MIKFNNQKIINFSLFFAFFFAVSTCLALARLDRNDPGNTPLIKACLANNLEQVKTLATNKRVLNIENTNGFTALDFARSPDMGIMVQIREALVKAGAREGSHLAKKK
jgi:hypothetical protein